MALEITLQSRNVLCYSTATGAAWVIVSGGQAPYTIEWTNSDGDVVSTGISARGLTADTYTVTVTDDYGATATASVEITEPDYEEPLDDIGMSLCNIKKCFLPMVACKLGNLTYKYFVDYPNQGIDCECKQKEITWLNGALDYLRGWYPEGTELVSGMQAEFLINFPIISCPIVGPLSYVVEATLTSSVDGIIAHYPPTSATSDYSDAMASFFISEINQLPNYFAVGDALSTNYLLINACGSQYEDATITLDIIITDLGGGCSIVSPEWTPTFDGGIFSITDGINTTCVTDEPCLTNEQVGTMIETMKGVLSDCNITELSQDLAAI